MSIHLCVTFGQQNSSKTHRNFKFHGIIPLARVTEIKIIEHRGLMLYADGPMKFPIGSALLQKVFDIACVRLQLYSV